MEPKLYCSVDAEGNFTQPSSKEYAQHITALGGGRTVRVIVCRMHGPYPANTQCPQCWGD